MVWASSIAASIKTRRPKAVAARVRHMLGHRKCTRKHYLMHARRSRHTDTRGTMGPMHVFPDASFAPTASASNGGSVYLIEASLVA